MKKKIVIFLWVALFAFTPFLGQLQSVYAGEDERQNTELEEDSLTVVRNGQAYAAVVIADETDEESRESADILVEYVHKSTNVKLPTLTAEQLDGTYTDEQVLIYIGMNDVNHDADVEEQLQTLDEDGYFIIPQESKITIVGPTDRGTRNGVYDFLERYLGILWLMPGEEWEHVPFWNTVFIPREIIREEPDFPFRSINMGGLAAWEDYRHIRTEWEYRNRIQNPRQLEMVHNLRSVVPVSKYGETNPEFYPNNEPPADLAGGWQPCFTAEGIVDVAIAEIIDYFDRNPEATSYSLSPNDRGGYCEADPAHPHYPNKLNSIGLVDMSDIFFGWVNDVVEGVLAVHPDKWFGVYAYQEVYEPPSFPVHPQVVPIITKDRHAWIDEEVRMESHEHLVKWQAVANQTGWYEYLQGYIYLLPRVYFHLMAENYQYAKEHNVTVHHADFHPSLGDGPKGWLAAKLKWDTDQDVDLLLQKWYEAAVGPQAAPYLAAYYDLWEHFWTERAQESGWFQSSKRNTYLSHNNVSYLSLVKDEDIHESRRLLETAVAKAETPEQQIRASQMLRQFEFYEASALTYPRSIERPESEEDALHLLANVQSELESRLHYVQRRHDLIEEFEESLILRYPRDPLRIVWTGWNAYEFWYLQDYMNMYEPDGGPVTEQVRKIAQGNKASQTRDFARLLLHTDMLHSLTEDPSFEEREDQASSWMFWNPEGSANITRTEEISRSGQASIKFENTARGGVYQTHPIKPGLVASEVSYYTPPGTRTNGSIRLVIEAFNGNGEKLIYLSDTVFLRETAGEWASIGFLEEIPDLINGQPVEHVLVNAQIHGAEDAIVYQDDLVVYQNAPSSVDLMAHVDRFREEGEIRDDSSAHQLNMHLTAINHFERQGEIGKVYQHMNEGFRILLDNMKSNGRISNNAYDALLTDAETLLQRMMDSLLKMTVHLQHAEVVIGDLLNPGVRVQLQNTGDEIVDPIVTVQWPEEFGVAPEEIIISTLNPGESTEVMFESEMPEGIPAGNYPVRVHIQFQHRGVNMTDSQEQSLYVLPMIEASLGTEQLNVHKAGDYPILLSLKNNGSRQLEVVIERELPEHVSLDFEDIIQLEPGQLLTIEGKVNVSSELIEGEYEALVRTVVGDEIVHELPLNVNYNRNLLYNPGFEEVEENAAGNLAPVGWLLRSGHLVQDEVHSGKYAVSMIADPENTWQVMNSVDLIPVTPGAEYKLSGWVKMDPAAGTNGLINVMLREIDGHNTTLHYHYITVVNEGGWTYFEEVIRPDPDAKSMNVFFHVSANNVNQAWFDDIRLEEVTPDNNLLRNPGFEEVEVNRNGDLVPVGWNLRTGHLVQDEVRSGEYAASMIADPGNTWQVMNSTDLIPIAPGAAYKLSGWVKMDPADGANGLVNVMLREIDRHNTTLHYDYITVVNEGGWTYFEEVIRPDADAKSMNVFFHIGSNNVRQAWFDDIRLEIIE